MSTTPVTISVVVPAYRVAATIGGTLTSILTQDVPGAVVDVVVVDDGSPDGTAQVVEGFIAAGLPVTLVRRPNGGVAAARNSGFEAATGELLATIDSDDLMLPGFLRTALEAWRAAGAGRCWVTVNGYLLPSTQFDPSRTVMHLPSPPHDGQVRAILEGNFAPNYALFPHAMADELGGYDESLEGCEDWDFWARAIICGWEAVVVRTPLAMYRWVPGSLSSSPQRMWEGEEAMLAGLRARYADHLSPADLAYLDKRIEAGSIMRLGRRAEDALRAGDVEQSRTLYRRITALSPTDRRSAVKARTLGVPGGFSFWRRRLLAADQATGRDKVAR